MNKENILLILWVIFGFVFVIAIESILYFLIHLLYFGLAELGISYNIMTYVFSNNNFDFLCADRIISLKDNQNKIKIKSIRNLSN